MMRMMRFSNEKSINVEASKNEREYFDPKGNNGNEIDQVEKIWFEEQEENTEKKRIEKGVCQRDNDEIPMNHFHFLGEVENRRI